MSFVAVVHPGEPDVLTMDSAPIPKAGPGEVLIKVSAAGVNRPDVAQRRGHYPPPPGASPILGLEVAGTVVAIGDPAPMGIPQPVCEWNVGDKVCALVSGGGYAEYCAAPAAQCLPVPTGFSMIEAAAIPETFFTVWTNVFQRARLAQGESILIHGGSGGIGTTAIQLAHAFDATVIATAGSDEKCTECIRFGASVAINYREEDFVEQVLKRTEGRGVDVILDMVGGSYLARNVSALAADGRLVQIAFLENRIGELDLSRVMVKRLTISGSTLRPRSVTEKAAIARELYERVWPLLDRGLLRPIIDSTFPITEVTAAHRRIESSAHVGKIVLTTEAA